MREHVRKDGLQSIASASPSRIFKVFGTTGGGGKKKGYVGKDVRLVLVMGILVPACKYNVKI